MIVIDTNIIISAIIKDSVTRKILVESSLDFGFPKISVAEIEKHKDYIMEKSGLGKLDFEKLLNTLFEYIYLIPQEIVQPQMEKAASVMGKIDIKDVVFLAAALALNSPIWTDDKDFERQNIIKIIKTSDLVRLFENV